MNEQIVFEAKSIEIGPSIKSSTRIELAVSLNSVDDVLDAIEEIAIKSYLEDRGFKVEKL